MHRTVRTCNDPNCFLYRTVGHFQIHRASKFLSAESTDQCTNPRLSVFYTGNDSVTHGHIVDCNIFVHMTDQATDPSLTVAQTACARICAAYIEPVNGQVFDCCTACRRKQSARNIPSRSAAIDNNAAQCMTVSVKGSAEVIRTVCANQSRYASLCIPVVRGHIIECNVIQQRNCFPAECISVLERFIKECNVIRRRGNGRICIIGFEGVLTISQYGERGKQDCQNQDGSQEKADTFFHVFLRMIYFFHPCGQPVPCRGAEWKRQSQRNRPSACDVTVSLYPFFCSPSTAKSASLQAFLGTSCFRQVAEELVKSYKKSHLHAPSHVSIAAP